MTEGSQGVDKYVRFPRTSSVYWIFLVFAICDTQITDSWTSREFSDFAKLCSPLHAPAAAIVQARLRDLKFKPNLQES
jgi:hypothetical protein